MHRAPTTHLQPIVIPSKEETQHISTFFSYQEEQVKQGLQKLSEKIKKKFKKFS